MSATAALSTACWWKIAPARDIPSTLSIFVGSITSTYWKTYWPGKAEKADYGTIKNVTFRNIRAEGMGRFGIMLEGRSDSKIQNVVFDDVQIASKGGGEKRPVPEEKPHSYPNLVYLYDGNVSTWGMFMRHVDGVTVPGRLSVDRNGGPASRSLSGGCAEL